MGPTAHKIIDKAAPILGAAVVLSGILLTSDRTWQLADAAAGLLITQAGRLRLGRRVHVDRRFQALRREVDHFIMLVQRQQRMRV